MKRTDHLCKIRSKLNRCRSSIQRRSALFCFRALTFFIALFFSATPFGPNKAFASSPFAREISLLGGISQSSGDGMEGRTAPAAGFLYARSFAVPEPEHFLLRMIADTVWSELTTSAQPLAHLAPQKKATATLVRFGFSGCYVWTTAWMACMDDGPRISWLNQGSSDAQVLGSFPLGLSAHNASFFPWIITTRVEFGRWDSREQGTAKKNVFNFWVGGVGYNW